MSGAESNVRDSIVRRVSIARDIVGRESVEECAVRDDTKTSGKKSSIALDLADQVEVEEMAPVSENGSTNEGSQPMFSSVTMVGNIESR